MKSVLLATCIFAASLLSTSAANADTMAYPSPEKASFLLDYPSDWEMTPGAELGDYTELRSPGGALLMFRTIEGSAESMEQAVKDSYVYVGENYENVKLEDPKDSVQRGLTGFYATGSGVEKDVGPVGFAMAWYVLKDGTIGEIWYVVAQDDKEGAEAAVKVLDSFRAP